MLHMWCVVSSQTCSVQILAEPGYRQCLTHLDTAGHTAIEIFRVKIPRSSQQDQKVSKHVMCLAGKYTTSHFEFIGYWKIPPPPRLSSVGHTTPQPVSTEHNLLLGPKDGTLSTGQRLSGMQKMISDSPGDCA